MRVCECLCASIFECSLSSLLLSQDWHCISSSADCSPPAFNFTDPLISREKRGKGRQTRRQRGKRKKSGRLYFVPIEGIHDRKS